MTLVIVYTLLIAALVRNWRHSDLPPGQLVPARPTSRPGSTAGHSGTDGLLSGDFDYPLLDDSGAADEAADRRTLVFVLSDNTRRGRMARTA